MAVKIRLSRRGRKKLALYDVIVADARAPRDGRFIEKLGTYNPMSQPAAIEINVDRAFHWIMNGAQPTDTVKAMLSERGILLRKHLQIGVLKGAITQEDADKKLEAWTNEKSTKSQSKQDTLSQTKAADAKARKEAETKVREAKAEAIRKKMIVAEPVAEETQAEVATEEVASTEEVATTEVATPEAPAEEAKPEASAEEATPEAPAEEKA